MFTWWYCSTCLVLVQPFCFTSQSDIFTQGNATRACSIIAHLWNDGTRSFFLYESWVGEIKPPQIVCPKRFKWSRAISKQHHTKNNMLTISTKTNNNILYQTFANAYLSVG